MPQNLFKFRDTQTGRTYEMPWSNPTPPTDDDIDSFVKAQETPKISAPTPVSQVEDSTPWYNRPLTTLPSRVAKGISEYIDPNDPAKGRSTGGVRGVTSAFIESLGNVGSEMTTPTNLAMTAVSGGAGMARSAAAQGIRSAVPLAKALRATEAIGSAGIAGKGAYDISQNPTDVGGYVEAGLGALGVKGAMSPIEVPRPPNPRIRAISEPLTKTDLINADAVKQVSDIRTAPKVALSPEEEILNALKEAKPLRKEQEQLYSQERAKRFAASKTIGETSSGQAGFQKELAALGGELPKANFTPISLKPESVDYLYDKIKNSDSLNQSTFEPIRARVALGKLLGESGGTVPQQNELELLGRVFGSDFIDKVQRLRPFSSQAKSVLAKTLGSAKAARATLDLSFPLRQGVFYIGNKDFWKAMGPMVRDALSPESFEARQAAIKSRPNAGLAQRSGLDLTDLHTKPEEQFVNNYLENIPGIGSLVKSSNRAYVSFGNQLRAGVFDGMIENLKKSGGGVNPGEAEAIAKYVNTTTGRGSLGSLEKIGGELNTALFSPRLASSRLQMVFRPDMYIRGSKEIRKQSLKSLLSLTGFMGSALGLAKMSGADVDLNPNSADFGKIKVGNARLDLGGGLLQPIRLASQLMSGEYVSKGKERQLGDTYVAPTRLDLLANYGVNKASPMGSFLLDILRGKTNVGQPLTVGGETENLFVPMVVQDFKDLMKEDPELLPLGLPAIFGAGVQVYPKKSGLRPIR